jgi:hypothetical protein
MLVFRAYFEVLRRLYVHPQKRASITLHHSIKYNCTQSMCVFKMEGT